MGANAIMIYIFYPSLQISLAFEVRGHCLLGSLSVVLFLPNAPGPSREKLIHNMLSVSHAALGQVLSYPFYETRAQKLAISLSESRNRQIRELVYG
jgi:hypothetical protein